MAALELWVLVNSGWQGLGCEGKEAKLRVFTCTDVCQGQGRDSSNTITWSYTSYICRSMFFFFYFHPLKHILCYYLYFFILKSYKFYRLPVQQKLYLPWKWGQIEYVRLIGVQFCISIQGGSGLFFSSNLGLLRMFSFFKRICTISRHLCWIDNGHITVSITKKTDF